jgi:hypothetical protein
MIISRSAAHAFWISAVMLLVSGCSGSTSSLAPSSPVQPAHRVVSYHGVLLPAAVVPKGLASRREAESMLGTPSARTRRLLYVSTFTVNTLTGAVLAYSLPHPPERMKFVYQTKRLSEPAGECSRTGRRTFWVVDSLADDLYEFEYGGKSPIKTLSTGKSEPSGCSVDPASGDVAAAIITGGDVLVWPKGGRTPITYSTPLSKTYFVGYDGSGNLFADGLNSADAFGLAELPKGGSSFEPVTLNQSIQFPGNIQWDGTYLAIGDQKRPTPSIRLVAAGRAVRRAAGRRSTTTRIAFSFGSANGNCVS